MDLLEGILKETLRVLLALTELKATQKPKPLNPDPETPNP